MSLIPFFVIIPLFSAFLVALLGRRIKNSCFSIALIATSCILVFALYILRLVNSYGTLTYNMGGWQPPYGIGLGVDGLSGLMLVIVSLISFLVTVYSLTYMKQYTDQWEFYSLFLLLISGLNGIIISQDLFNFYIFLELASICGYALVAFGVEAESLEAAFKYAVMGTIGSVFILLGIAILYSYASTLNMAGISAALTLGAPKRIINFVSVLFLAGFGLKAALVPFHAWLADAHSSAPTPVSAVLSGVFIKTLGVYAMARIFFNMLGVSAQISLILMFLGVISMVLGAFLAIAQDDIKRMFAYSSISQVGYIVFALGIGTPLAILGALFHVFNHAVSKSLLFLNAGAIEYSTGTRSLSKLGGLSQKLPVPAYTSLAGAMSISGLPPFGGFWSKLIIIVAAIQSGQIGFSIVAVLVSIITLVYYLKFQHKAFFVKPLHAHENVKSTPLAMKISLIALALISIAAGLAVIPFLKNFLQLAVGGLSSGGAQL